MSDLTELPESLAAGTTVKYTRSLPDYPASAGWTLTLALAGAGVLSVNAAPSGDNHAMTLTAEQTAGLPAGTYRWAEQVEKSGEVYRVASGRVIVEPNLQAALAGEQQSGNEKLLAAVEAMIAKRMGTSEGALPKDIESYAIDGIAVTKVPLEQLLKLRTVLSYAVARERRGGGFGRQHRITFTGAANE